MSDIDKLMTKLKSKKKAKKTPKEDEKKKKKKVDEEVEVEEDEGLENEETHEEEEQETEDQTEPIPATATDKGDVGDVIEQEVAVLQNDGIFRRELILTLKELIDVHKINTQALLDLQKLIRGEDGQEE